MALRSFFLSFFILCSLYSIAQYPLVGTKIRLGFQTTGDGLVYRGDGPPNYSVVGANNAYMYIDKTTGRFYLWDTVTTTFKPLPFANGTAGYLPIFNDSNTLGNSVVSYNSTDNILNIGDNNSVIKLYLNGEEISASPSTNLSVFPDFFFTQLNNGIIGSGYPNQVAYFTTSNFIESSSNFTYLDNKLGLNTMTPDSTLTVIGGGRFTDDITLSKNIGFIKIGEYQEINGEDVTNALLYFNYSAIPITQNADTTYFSIFSPTESRNYFRGRTGFGVLPSYDAAVEISFDSVNWVSPPAPPGSKAGSTYALDVLNGDNITLSALNNYSIRARTIGNEGSSNNTAGLFSATNGSPSGMFSSYTIAIDAISSGNSYSFGGRFRANSGTIRNSAIEISSSTATDSISYAIYSTSTAKTYLNGKLGLGTSSPDSMLTVIGGGRFTNQLTTNRLVINTYSSEIFSINNYAPTSSFGNNIWIGNGGQNVIDGGISGGTYNISLGFDALLKNSTGINNIAIGYGALSENTIGSENISFGVNALTLNVSGGGNTALGVNALGGNITGSNNIAIGRYAGSSTVSLNINDNSNESIYIGESTRSKDSTSVNEIVIGYQGLGNGSNTTTIGNTNTTKTVFPSGKLGVGTTSPDSTLTVIGGGRFTNNITVGGSKVIIASDTSTMLSPYLKKQDTTSLSNRIDTKLNIADTSVFARNFQISGTSGQVTYFNGSNTVTGDANLTWSAANRTLGINTTTTSGANIIIKNTQEPIRDAAWLPQQTFGADTTNWTRGTGWTFNGTQAVATAATGALTYTTLPDTIISGRAYEVTYTLAGYSAGTVTVALGNVSLALPAYNVTGNAVLLQPTSATGGFRFTTSTFTGNLDNISIVEISNPAPILISGQDDNSTTLYRLLAMPNLTSFALGGGGRYITGNNNTAIGTQALNSNTTGNTNMANGFQALYSNTTGNSNMADGFRALYSNTTGGSNTAIGYQALYSNTTGSINTANGQQALYSNTTGNSNVANGYQALFSNTIASNNTANGFQALLSNTIGSGNMANGYQALYSNTTGINNVANGYQALYSNTTGNSNVANGYQALNANTTGNNNSANGYRALYSNTTGGGNTAIGFQALVYNTTGNSNMAEGYQALYSNTTGINNAANGYQALRSNTTGNSNTANGYQVLYSNTTGNSNTANGYRALFSNTTGNNNTALGVSAMYNITAGDTLTGSNNIAIGNSAADNIRAAAEANVAIGNQVDLPTSNGSNQGVYQNVLFFTGASGTGTTIAAGSRAGIKTNAPASDFHVAGEVRIDDLKPTGAPRNIVGSSSTGDLSTMAWGNGLTVSVGDTILRADTSVLASKTWVNNEINADTISLSNRINTKLNISDTSVFARDWQITGTANYIPEFTGTNSIGNSIIYENSGKIGINTLTADSLLTVNGGFRTVNDANINGVRVGRGLGNIATNTVLGSSALNSNTTGLGNVSIGIRALRDNTTGSYNISVGFESGMTLTSASRNTLIGSFTGGVPSTNLTGNDNTGVGYSSLYVNTTGAENSSVGAYSLDANTTGGYNSALGAYTLTSNTVGNYNTATGYGALAAITTGSTNVGVGYNAGFYITSGGSNQTSGSSVYIGNDSRASADGNTNEITIGASSRGQGSNSIMLGNSSIANLYCYDTSISSPSDERDKKNVETLEIGLDFILGLRPVVFDWNMRDGGKKDIPDIGFIAQEVEPLQSILPQGDNLNVVHYQAQDDRYFMQSANLIPVLVKAIQEQQKQIELLKAEINQLKK